MEKRNQCFDAGAAKRRALSKPQEIAFLRSVFVFQQRLVADLQQGRLTYAEFNQRAPSWRRPPAPKSDRVVPGEITRGRWSGPFILWNSWRKPLSRIRRCVGDPTFL